MRNLLALVAAAVLAFAGIGWYLGWYKVQTDSTPTGRHISIDLNTPKIREDVDRGKEKVRDFLGDDNNNTNPTPSAPPSSNVTPAGYQRPAGKDSFTPVPPSGNGPTLPPPR
jgi:hypothetical protein